jgi:hypothetical protein
LKLIPLIGFQGCPSFFMGKSLLSISRTIGKKTETVELAKLEGIAEQEIRRRKEKNNRLRALTLLTPAQNKALIANLKDCQVKLADLDFKIRDLQRQEREILLRGLEEEERIILNPNAQ